LPRYEILLPIKFNDGSPVPEELFLDVCDELTKKFTGFRSSPPSSPAVGWWKDPKTGMLYKDDILVYIVYTIQDEDEFFEEYAKVLAVRFRQEKVWIERVEVRQIG
jgi:hypothetical protein